MEGNKKDSARKKISLHFCIIVLMITIVFSFLGMSYNKITNKYNFFKSEYFNYLLDDYKNLLAMALFNNNDVKEPTMDTLSSDDIKAEKDRYINELNEKYAQLKNSEINQNEDGEYYEYDEDLQGILEDKRKNDLQEIKDEISATIANENIDKIKEKALASKLEQYKIDSSAKISAEKDLKEITYFKYYYKPTSGENETNIDGENLQRATENARNVETSNKVEITGQDEGESSSAVYIITPREGLDINGSFYRNMTRYNTIKDVHLTVISWITIGSLIILLYMALNFKKYNEFLFESREAKFLAYKIPVDVLIGIFFITFIYFAIVKEDTIWILGSFSMGGYGSNILEPVTFSSKYVLKLFLATLYLTVVSIPIIKIIIDSIKDKKKRGEIFNSSLIIRFIKRADNNINSKTFYKTLIFKFLIFLALLITTLTLGMAVNEGLFLAMLFGWMMLIFIFILNWVICLEKIIRGVKLIASGKADHEIKVMGSRLLKNLALDINNIGKGIKAAAYNETKSERLRTELITNVSHDLKTPLTSIISYIDLLKQEDITEEERKSFINIIDRKSQNLKMLIEDLFDITKMSSGNMELNLENIDIIMLLNQTIGEFSDKIETSGLNFKYDIPEKDIYINIDGKRIWRVFQNLLVNILKYSQNGTRVYVVLKDYEDRVQVEFKNISAYEMNFNASELFERFKRGDESRNTEGTGLGLAIAQTIVNLHKGNLEIKIDGDLFKVIMTIYK